MPKFSNRSTKRLETCDHRLQIIFRELIKFYDCSVICGHRNARDQNAAYYAVPQNSKVKWPNSEHNDVPAKAVDVVPYPYGWDNIKQFYFMAGCVEAIATKHGYNVRWGGDWDDDLDFDDNGFMDLGHWEIVD